MGHVRAFALVFVLVPLAGAFLPGAARPAVAQSGPVGDFTWTVPDRYVDRDGDGHVDAFTDADAVNPPAWPVDLTACGGFTSATPIADYTWTIRVPGQPDDVRSGPACSVRKDFPAQGTYSVTLKVTNGAGESTEITNDVIVKDFLIVSMGDSIGSGEGNPHRLTLPYPGAIPIPVWQDSRCHRSAVAGSARAALMVERNDRRTSVTFLHVACSGASMRDNDPKDDKADGGILDPYEGQEAYPDTFPEHQTPLPPQVDQVRDIVGVSAPDGPLRRPIDAILLSIGANDLEFAKIIELCLLTPYPCWTAGGNEVFDANIGKLEQRYAEVDQAFKDKLGVRPEQVYQTEYPDPLHDDQGWLCMNILGGITLDEVIWAHDNVVPGLTAEVNKNAARRWQIVPVAAEFEKHGYCAMFERWFVQMQHSLMIQWGIDGAFHPNMTGHGAYADALYAKLRLDLRLPPEDPHLPAAGFTVDPLPDGRFRLTDVSTDKEGLVGRLWNAPGVTTPIAPVVEAESVCGKSQARLTVTNVRNKSATAARVLERADWQLPGSADPAVERRFADADAQAVFDAHPASVTAKASACGDQFAEATGPRASAGQRVCLPEGEARPFAGMPHFPCRWSVRTPLGYSSASVPVEGPGAERFAAAADVARAPDDDPFPEGLPGRSVDGYVSGGQVYQVLGEPGTLVSGELLVDASAFSGAQSSGGGQGDVRVDLYEALPPQPPCDGEECGWVSPRQLASLRLASYSHQCDGYTINWSGSWTNCQSASSSYYLRAWNEQGEVADHWLEDDRYPLMYKRLPERIAFTVPAGTYIRTSTSVGAYATVSKYCPYANTSRLCAVSTHMAATVELVPTTAGGQIVPLASLGTEPGALPGAPEGLQATGGLGSVQLSWAAPGAGAAAVSGYVVYRDGAPVAETAAHETSYLDEGLGEGATHAYAVAARSADGVGEPSAPVSATTFARPGVPQSVRAAAGPGVTEVTVSWQPPAADGGTPVTAYRVYRDGTQVAEVPAGTTSFTEERLVPMTAYRYAVSAVNVVGEGERSPMSCASSGPVVPVLPDPCDGLSRGRRR